MLFLEKLLNWFNLEILALVQYSMSWLNLVSSLQPLASLLQEISETYGCILTLLILILGYILSLAAILSIVEYTQLNVSKILRKIKTNTLVLLKSLFKN